MDSPHFFQRLQSRAEAINSLLCVGLDPRLPDDKKTAEHALHWCRAVIDATSPYTVAYKPNSAFFEAFGADGLEALRKVFSNLGGLQIPRL